MHEEIETLRDRLALRERQIAAMHRISAALFSRTELDELLRETLRVSLDTVDADAGSVLLYDREKRMLVFRYVIGGATWLVGQEIDPEADTHSKAASVFRGGESSITLDTRTEGHDTAIDSKTGYRTQSILTVPLKTMGEPIGVMQALNKRRGHFDREDQELLEIVSSLASTSIMNATLAQEAQLAAVARAVGDLSHDIKNALTPVETMVDTTVAAFIEPMYADLEGLIQAWKDAPEKVRSLEETVQPLRDWYPEMQTAVRDGCTDIREMVGEIADYVKGVQSTHFEVGNLAEIVGERLRRLQVVARDRRVTLHLDSMEDIPPFPFDRRLLGRAIFNLVNNALGAINDAVKRGNLELRASGFNVWVRAFANPSGTFPDGAYCRIEVRDDGPGIPDSVKASLFTQHAISTTPGGTGIGTRFVKSVADAHGGLVGVDSDLGAGACFWMKLPLTRDKDGPLADY